MCNLITTTDNKEVILHYHNLIQQTKYASHPIKIVMYVKSKFFFVKIVLILKNCK
jgi:hypothetical protein